MHPIDTETSTSARPRRHLVSAHQATGFVLRCVPDLRPACLCAGCPGGFLARGADWMVLLEAGSACRREHGLERRIAHLAAAQPARLKLRLSSSLALRAGRPHLLAASNSASIASAVAVHGACRTCQICGCSSRVLIDGEYSVSAERPRVVLDLGSHIGTSLHLVPCRLSRGEIHRHRARTRGARL